MVSTDKNMDLSKDTTFEAESASNSIHSRIFIVVRWHVAMLRVYFYLYAFFLALVLGYTEEKGRKKIGQPMRTSTPRQNSTYISFPIMRSGDTTFSRTISQYPILLATF